MEGEGEGQNGGSRRGTEWRVKERDRMEGEGEEESRRLGTGIEEKRRWRRKDEEEEVTEKKTMKRKR